MVKNLSDLLQSFSGMSHISVLPEEVIGFLQPHRCAVMVDATLGLGGHTALFFQNHSRVRVIAFDQDMHARETACQNLERYKKNLTVVPRNFEHLPAYLVEHNLQPDAVLFDVGVSSLHLDDASRGFSIKNDGPLDMRMNVSERLSAAEIVAEYSEEQLKKIFRDYGEERFAQRIARAIVERREKTPFTRTVDLAQCVMEAKPKLGRFNGGGHSATQVFQALRIAVNRELEVLEKALMETVPLLASGGRLAVITFHSLEDRIVKNIFSAYCPVQKRQKYGNIQSNSLQNQYRLLTKKPVIPLPEEIERNPRSRSAKLRVIEKR